MIAARAVAVAVAGCVLILVAFTFDAAPLFVPGVAFTAIGVCSPAWIWATARGARVRRVLTADRVIEDQLLEASIAVRRGGLGLPGAEVLEPLTGSRLDLSGPLSPLQGDRSASVSVVARFHRRGLHTLAPPSLIVSDPLALCRLEVASDEPGQQLLVLPRTEPVRWLRESRGRRLSAADGRASSEALAAVDFDGLRPYRAGTPASRIHWPALARGAGLIERRLQADSDSRPLVVLDSRTQAGAGVELIDAAVRAAASLVLDLARSGGCGLLLPGEPRPTAIDRELSAWPAAHARLAMVTGGTASRPPATASAAGRRGPLIYVAASPVARLAAALGGSGARMTVLVVPDALVAGGRPPAVRRAAATLEVSGCRGFVLGARAAADRPVTANRTPATAATASTATNGSSERG
ncbi:MAG: DUF58 domain-containing protein [Solirubrobacteraceae bacterium]